MARRSKNKNTSLRSRRDIFIPIARRSLPLTVYEDRRLFHPDPLPAARSFNRRVARIVEHPRNVNVPSRLSGRSFSTRFSFDVPADVLVCVRRKIRKEVIHAIGKSGKAGQRPPRRNQWSDIHC